MMHGQKNIKITCVYRNEIRFTFRNICGRRRGYYCRKIPISTAIFLPYPPVDNMPVEASPVTGDARQNIVASKARQFLWQCFGMLLTLNLPTTTIVAQPFNVIKWQLKFNPVA